MSALKRLRVDERSERVSWRNPEFADWKLTWRSGSPSEQESWDVHRCIISGGERPALFFVGAARNGAYESRSTELSTLLPAACKSHVPSFLDFVYVGSAGEMQPKDVMPLLKIADVLQCPKLYNLLIDFIDKEALGQTSGALEVMLKDACVLELLNVAESIGNLVPSRLLTALDFDLLEVDSPNLIRAVARKIAGARLSTWGAFAGHGQVTAEGSLAIAVLPGEISRKMYWCHATGYGQVFAKTQSWRLRVDRVRSQHTSLVFGIVAHDRPSLASHPRSGDLITTSFKTCAFAIFAYGDGVADGSSYHVNVSQDCDWKQTAAFPQRELRRGDIISIIFFLSRQWLRRRH